MEHTQKEETEIMAELTFGANGALTIRGDGHVDLSAAHPAHAYVDAAMELQPGDEFALPELYPMLTASAKAAIGEAVESDERRQTWFRDLSSKFATIGAVNGTHWTRKEIEPVWCRLIKTWMIDEIIKSRSGIVFVRLSTGGILSEDEFVSIEGKGIEDHLDEFVEATTYGVAEIKAILRARLIEREVSAINKNGDVETLKLVGPDVISIDQWAHPPGYTLMCSEFQS